MELLQGPWRTKVILIDDKPIKLYSVDAGKLWVSKPSDVKRFKQRRADIKAAVQHFFMRHDLSEAVESTAADFWG